MSGPAPVNISVLLPAYNAEDYILQSVQSVLAQTLEDFELIVVDDCSTDGTGELLASIRDPRLRVMRNSANLGIVGSLNRAMTAARGRFIARTDADDYCLPTRFAKQRAFLDQNPDIALVGTEMFYLENGTVKRGPQLADADPDVLRWQLQITNRVAHPSMMFRTEIVGQLGEYLREPFKYAEDFDFTHRVLRHGRVAVLPERLMIYRLHGSNVTRRHRAEMISKVIAVFGEAYAALLGHEAGAEAALVAEHLTSGVPVASRAELVEVGMVLERLMQAYVEANRLTTDQASSVLAHAATAWWGAVQGALRAGLVLPARFGPSAFRNVERARPPLRKLARSALGGLLDQNQALASWFDAKISAAPRNQGHAIQLQDTNLQPAAVQASDPPSLYVVVDTEAEFDWSKPFDRSLTAVTAMAYQERAQAIFDRYGLRPLYVVDYAVASQPAGFEPLRAIMERHACAIGAHLHPWINPPFEETISPQNSFAGNLPADLERRKLESLCAQIRKNFGISPLFFKAGRYGIGPNTIQTLQDLGFAVDFSIMPRADERSKGGVDFRTVDARPYWASDGDILSVPMTRAHLGLLAPFGPVLHGAIHSQAMQRFGVPGILARLGLLNTVTLTPEGVTAREQIALVRALMQQGYRTFVLHYHSPSLMPGHTPYVRTDTDLSRFLARIEAVCRFFFDETGGMPGNPADLLPQDKRDCLWPDGRPGTAAAGPPTPDMQASPLTSVLHQPSMHHPRDDGPARHGPATLGPP